MAFENLNTYANILNGDGTYSLNGNFQLDITNQDRRSLDYYAGNKGAIFGGDFVHEFEFQIVSHDIDGAYLDLYGIGDVAKANTTMFDDGDAYIGIWGYVGYPDNVTSELEIYIFHNGSTYINTSNKIQVSHGTTYYARLEKNMQMSALGTVIFSVYSDAARTVLVDRLSLDSDMPLARQNNLSYIFAGQGYASTSSSKSVTSWIRNIELHSLRQYELQFEEDTSIDLPIGWDYRDAGRLDITYRLDQTTGGFRAFFGDTSNDNRLAWRDDDDDYTFKIDDSNNTFANPPDEITRDTYETITLHWPGSGGNISIQVNGGTARSVSGSTNILTDNISLGRNFGSFFNGWKGRLKDVKYYGAGNDEEITNWWKIDDNVANGGTITDILGGEDGTLSLGSGSWVDVNPPPAREDYELQFNTDTAINLPVGWDYRVSGKLEITATKDILNNTMALFGAGTEDIYRIRSGDHRWRIDDSNNTAVDPPPLPAAGASFKIVFTWDGGGVNHTVTIDDGTPWSFTPSGGNILTGNMILGKKGSASEESWQGRIKNIKYYGAGDQTTLTNHWYIDDNSADGGSIVDHIGGVNGTLDLGGGQWVGVSPPPSSGPPTQEDHETATTGSNANSLTVSQLTGGQAGDIVAVFVSGRQSNSVTQMETASSNTAFTQLRRRTNDQGQNFMELWASKDPEAYQEDIDISFSASKIYGAVAILIRGADDSLTLPEIFATVADNSNPSNQDNDDMKVALTNSVADVLVLFGGTSRAATIDGPMNPLDVEIEYDIINGGGGDATNMHVGKQTRDTIESRECGADGCLSSNRDWVIIATEVLGAAGDPAIRLPITPFDGQTDVGVQSNITTTIYNDGGADLTLSSPTFNGVRNFVAGDWQISSGTPFPRVINPGSSVDVTLEFTPSIPGTQDFNFSFDTDDPLNPGVSIVSQGRGVGSGELITVVVDPGAGAGTDYTSLAAAILDKADDYVGLDFLVTYKVRATGSGLDTTPVLLGGSITSATRFPTIEPFDITDRCGPAYFSDDKYILYQSGAGQTAIDITDDFFKIDGIQIYSFYSLTVPTIDWNPDNPSANIKGIVEKCFIVAPDNAPAFKVNNDCEFIFANNAVFAGEKAIDIPDDTLGNKIIYNNTLNAGNRTTTGFSIGNNTVGAMKNNALRGYSSACISLGTGLSGFATAANLTDDNSSPDSGFENRTIQLVNSGSNYHMLPQSPGFGEGEDLRSDPLYPITEDSGLNLKEDAAAEIGCDEILSKDRNAVVIRMATANLFRVEAVIDTDNLQVLRVYVRNESSRIAIVTYHSPKSKTDLVENVLPGAQRISEVNQNFFEALPVFFNSAEGEYEIDSTFLTVDVRSL